MKPLSRLLLLVFLLAQAFACRDEAIIVPTSPYPISEDAYVVDTIVGGFTIPYGLAIVGEHEYFITDRIGKLYYCTDGRLTEITGLPEVATFGDPGIAAILHGGLMDVSLHPDYPSNGWMYVAYLGHDSFAKVARFKVTDDAIAEWAVIFRTRNHNFYGNGMRIVWQDSLHFFLNVGGSTLTTNTDPILVSQDLNEDAGKIHRLRADGSVPPDNPVMEGMRVPGSIWSYGHRDVQGLHYEAATNTLFGVEHGPKGGDEFNIIEPGRNYGWPLFTRGINYDGAPVSLLSEAEAARSTVLPEYHWTVPTDDGGQAIAPACLLKVDNSTVSDWNGHFLIGSLAFRRLLKYNRATDETFGTHIEGRVRTIRQLPSGDLIALIERNHTGLTNGRVVRIKN